VVQINWTKQARDDLRSIADYISIDSVTYAKLQVIKIRSKTQLLKSHGRAGRLVSEIEHEDIRELIEGNYRIIYKTISSTRVDILAIHHSARDLIKRQIK